MESRLRLAEAVVRDYEQVIFIVYRGEKVTKVFIEAMEEFYEKIGVLAFQRVQIDVVEEGMTDSIAASEETQEEICGVYVKEMLEDASTLFHHSNGCFSQVFCL
jgi:hypothetical protein